MRFCYIGEYPNGLFIEQYGYVFKPGEFVEVTDDFAVRKLSGNRFFVADSAAPDAKSADVAETPAKRRGRPPKVQVSNEHQD